MTPADYIRPPDFRHSARLPDTEVEQVRRVVALAAIVPGFERRLARTTGRHLEGITVEALLVAMLVAGCDRRAMHLTEFSDVMHHRLSDDARASLGITRPRPYLAPAHATPDQKDRARQEQSNAVKQVERLLHRMLEPLDPSPNPKNRVRDPDAHSKKIKHFDPEEQARRHALLDWTANRLLEATWLTLPRAVRRSWKGSLVQDATYLKAWAAPVKKNPDGTVRWVSSDPDAGWYIRTGDHRADGTEGHTKIKWGYEGELTILGPDNAADQDKFPRLAIALTVKAPGLDPAGHGIRMLDEISRRHLLFDPETGEALPPHAHPDGPTPEPHPTGWLAADRAYSNTPAEAWALPLRALGYRPVMDYREDQLGIQGSDQGMLLVEGTWYSPSMPQPLIEATADYKVHKTIDEATYRTRIAARRSYAIRLGPIDANGDRRAFCQASSTPSGSMRAITQCREKPDSLADPSPFRGARPLMPLLVTVAGAVPKICQQTTVKLFAGVHSKHQQDLPYESPEWHAVYHPLRNLIEGSNAHCKDTSTSGIEEAKRRRIRGIAATTLLLAVGIAAENLRKIAAFYRRADSNDDGSMTVNRPKPSRAKRRVHTTLGEHRPRLVNARNKPQHPTASPANPETPRRRAARTRRDTPGR